MSETLMADELIPLLRRVFGLTPADRGLAILVDLPDDRVPDHEAWRVRRKMAAGWAAELRAHRGALGLDTDLVVYRNAGSNNADLPATAWIADPGAIPESAEALDPAQALPFARVFDTHSVLLAPTELSATAPLKIMAKKHGFRAATMPGFSPGMVPALRLDYGEIRRRVRILKDLLDRADEARLEFEVDRAALCSLRLDLRNRAAHASDGILDVPGTAGNLPSGEAYIVPYEGEVPGMPSRSEGTLPVQLGDEVVRFEVRQNRAIAASGGGPAAGEQRDRLVAEPAYGNLAELGLGVLADLGVEPCGELLLDEKLGLHVAFGRSDHFGGQVGPSRFSSPAAVVHIDRVYVPSLQPRIVPRAVDLILADGRAVALMRDGRYAGVF